MHAITAQIATDPNVVVDFAQKVFMQVNTQASNHSRNQRVVLYIAGGVLALAMIALVIVGCVHNDISSKAGLYAAIAFVIICCVYVLGHLYRQFSTAPPPPFVNPMSLLTAIPPTESASTHAAIRQPLQSAPSP